MKSRGGAEESRREEQKREEEKREEQKRDDQRRESLRRKDPGARKGSKIATHCVFPMICGSGGRLAKAAGAEPAGQMRDEKLRREAHFQVKMHKAHQVRTTFGSCDVEKVHAVVARSTFPKVKMHKAHQVRATFGSWDVERVHAAVARSTFASEKAINTARSEHFWKLRCRKSAHCCGAKHISKSQCTKHTMFGPLFWSCDVEKVFAVVARSTFRSQNVN